MADAFKKARYQDWRTTDPDIYGVGHTEQRNAYRKKQNRRVRRVFKQNLKKELY